MTAKARKMKAEGIDVISFAAGEPDFNTPEAICEAAVEAIHQGQTKYAPSSGLPALRTALVAKLLRENHIHAADNELVVSCGAKHSLYNAFMVLIEPGDEVILIAPYWMTYADQIMLAGGVPVIVQTTHETGFCPHIDQLKEAITPRTKAIVVNSPGNPTGGAMDRTQIKEIAALALRHDLWVISDEIYERLTYNHPHTSIASLGKAIAARTVTITGCSKTYAMTGWRIGFAHAPAPVAQAMSNLQDQVTSNATTFAQVGAIAALNLPDTEVEKMRAEFEVRRDLGLGLLNKIPGIAVSEPKGAFYFFANVSAVLGGKIPTDLELADLLLEQAHVATVPGSVFHGPGHLRLSYAASRADIEKGIARIGEFLAKM